MRSGEKLFGEAIIYVCCILGSIVLMNDYAIIFRSEPIKYIKQYYFYYSHKISKCVGSFFYAGFIDKSSHAITDFISSIKNNILLKNKKKMFCFSDHIIVRVHRKRYYFIWHVNRILTEI